MFLTDDELFTLTGYRRASKQIEQLRAQRIPFHVTRAGHPRVARAVIEGGKRRASETTSDNTWSPAWASLKKLP